jgi:hypothetical protein
MRDESTHSKEIKSRSQPFTSCTCKNFNQIYFELLLRLSSDKSREAIKA